MKIKKLKLAIALIVLLVPLAFFVFTSSLLDVSWMRRGSHSTGIMTDDFSSAPVELIRASIDAYGGSQKLRALKEISLKNTITIYGNDQSRVNGNSMEYYRFPDMVRVDFSFGSEKVTHLYDGLEAWTTAGGKVAKAPDFLTESLRRSVKHFPNTLLLAVLDERSDLGRAVAGSYNSKDVFTLELTDREGDQSKIWIDAETLMMVRIDYTLFSSLGADTMSVVISDYRMVDGIQTAFKATIYYNGAKAQETTVEEVRYNPNLPDSLFQLPPIDD